MKHLILSIFLFAGMLVQVQLIKDYYETTTTVKTDTHASTSLSDR